MKSWIKFVWHVTGHDRHLVIVYDHNIVIVERSKRILSYICYLGMLDSYTVTLYVNIYFWKVFTLPDTSLDLWPRQSFEGDNGLDLSHGQLLVA